MLALALEQKIARIKDRIYRLLTLIYPWRDIAAAQWTLAHGDTRSRASASEYLDNILEGAAAQAHHAGARGDAARGEGAPRQRPAQDAAARRRGNAAAADQRRRSGGRGRGDRRRAGSRRSGRSPTTSSTCWRTATCATGTSSRPRRGRSPSSGCRRSGAASSGTSRCRPRSWRRGCASCRSSPSVSIDELFRIAVAARQVRHDPGSVLLAGRRGPRDHPLPARRPRHRLEPRRRAALDRGAGRPRVHRSAVRDADARNAAHRRPRGDAGDAPKRAADAARRQHRPRERPVRDAVGDAAGRDRDRGPARCGGRLRELARSGLTPVEKVLALQRVPLFARVTADEMRHLADIAAAVD